MSNSESPKKGQKILDLLTDRGAMFAAILVSLGTVTLMFVVITPDLLIFRIIMGTMGAILVLFSPRALAKRKFGLWRWIAVLIVFAEVSTVLTMTDTQSQDSDSVGKIDPVLSHLQAATNTAQDNLTKFIDQQATATTTAFLTSLKEQIAVSTQVLQEAKRAETDYRPAGQVSGIDPNKLFMAIPSAIISLQLARYMTLAFSLIVAVIFQAVVFATVNATVKQIKRVDTEKAPRKRKRTRKPAEPKQISESDFIQEPQEPSMIDAV
jgi:hypothetical protein